MPAWVVPAAIAAGGAIINAFQGWRAKKANEGYIRKQNEYNSPRSQMARYQSGGLNPHLVYSQGNPGNQSQAMQQPESLQNAGSTFSDSYNRSALAQSQVATQTVTRDAIKAKTEVSKLQARVLEQNPYLDESYLNAVVNSMIATANDKMNKANISRVEAEFTKEHGYTKLLTELDLMLQRFDLGTADQKIKAEVLQSKEFQNALSEIQLKWLKDGDITPQHIYQGIMLLLSKLR